MEVEHASLCNIVIKFLIDQQYLLTAFELLHELTEDGHSDWATRLQQFFADPEMFPPEEMLRLQNLQVANPQRVVEERDAAEEKATIMEYELRLAKEDVKRLLEKLDMKTESPPMLYSDGENGNSTEAEKQELMKDAKRKVQSILGPLRESERRALNWAVKEFLLGTGYKLTAMTFYEEVDQDLDAPQTGPAYVPDALRRYYLHFLSASPEEIEERAMLQEEKELLIKDKDKLLLEIEASAKSIEVLEQEKTSLTKSLQTIQKDSKNKERKILNLKESLKQASEEVNGCRMEITSLKLQLESFRVSKGHAVSNEDSAYSIEEKLDSCKPQVEPLKTDLHAGKHRETGYTKEGLKTPRECKTVDQRNSVLENPTIDVQEDKGACIDLQNEYAGDLTESSDVPEVDKEISVVEQAKGLGESFASDRSVFPAAKNDPEALKSLSSSEECVIQHGKGQDGGFRSSKHELETVEILADALPKIVPYVLINHREELLPLMICAIERHPKSNIRDLLTHNLFNLIKRPDENQRRIIMDACLSLSKSIGEERTELELLPQCWEQINHKYEERRLLVAQSCGELAQFVKADIRTSLILSIVQQLIEDPAAVVREAAAHNLTMLLSLSPSMDKYFKVEEMMFQLILDPTGMVVETTLKELVPAVVRWAKHGNQPLRQLLRLLLSNLLGSAQHCPPVSGVEGSMESNLRVLGERERWNVDVMLRMLTELLPEVLELVKTTCPCKNMNSVEDTFFSESLIQIYFRGQEEWPAFDWLHVDCLPSLLQLACMLPSREDSLRTRLSKLLLAIRKWFGNHYHSFVMLPIFLTAVGDRANISHFPANLASQVKALKPKTDIGERLAILCILPLLLAGVLGAPDMQEQLAGYLRDLVLQHALKQGALTSIHTPEIIDAVRFLCSFKEEHGVIVGVLWDLVVNANADVKISVTSLLKVLVPYVDARIATHDVLPALVTLGSDPNLLVKYSSIDAFGAVAQHFKDEVIVDKIRVQMDAFLEDGSHEATVAVVRALAIAVPLTTPSLRDYLLQKLLSLTGVPLQGITLMRRRERADVFCEAIRALDATDLSLTIVKDLLLPTIQNLQKDPDALDPAHKEALELISRERSSGRLDSITKVMGSHLTLSGMTSLFGETGFLVKKDNLDLTEPPSPQPPPQEEGRLFRMMRGNFGDMIRGRGKTNDE